MPPSAVEERAINAIRFLAADAVQQAKSGHPGMPMGAAAMAFALWTRHLRFDPRAPVWPNRDRFVLSAGHGSMLLYALLHLSGFDLSMDDLRQFRQWGSKTPGHPEYGHTPGVETTTGPLGQGFATGVGMALAGQHLAGAYNRPGFDLFDHFVYGIVSDGDLMEGVASEAASLAGHFRLGRLIYLYDDNRITIDGSTDLTFSEDRVGRFASYGWHVISVDDGNDVEAIDRAIQAAKADPRPSLIACRTHIGYGLPTKQDKASAHGEPAGDEELDGAKRRLGWPTEPRFHVPDDAREPFQAAARRGAESRARWLDVLAGYRKEHAGLAAQLERVLSGEFPGDVESHVPEFPADEKGMATRASSGKVLNALAAALPELIGGSADLSGSNQTVIKDAPKFSRESPAGRNLHFGVREHAMGAALNGMALSGGLIPYGGTFLVFSDYMRPAIRLAAMMGLRVIYVFTHDSIGLGEDGPTHQPVEHLAALRAIPNLAVIRPADANETRQAWLAALDRAAAPTALILTRQALPTLDRRQFGNPKGLRRGAYVLADPDKTHPDVILMASGSEVEIALSAAEKLAAKGLKARVVSFPSWELFEQQTPAYRNKVLPPEVTARVAIEAGAPMGWHRWVGEQGAVLAIDRFGASAPYQELYRRYGLSVERLVKEAERVHGQAGKRRSPGAGKRKATSGAGKSAAKRSFQKPAKRGPRS